jgi:hypothetical protein
MTNRGNARLHPHTPSAMPTHRHVRKDDANAFLPDPGEGPAHAGDDLAQELAEEFVEGVTTGDHVAEDALNETVAEENGGPFVPSTAGVEFAEGTDASNPPGTKREPRPSPMRSSRR